MKTFHWPGHKWTAYKENSNNFNNNESEMDRIRELHIHEHQRINAAQKVTDMLKQYKENHGLTEDSAGITLNNELDVTEYKNHKVNNSEPTFESENGEVSISREDEEVDTKEATSAGSAGAFSGPLR